MSFFEQSSIRVLRLSAWLDMAAGLDPAHRVVLPMIQRGFIWKPAQIIDLWDSLLQGMPIGTLMVTEMPDHAQSVPLWRSEETRQPDLPKSATSLGLVDGQQRTLAMVMGWSQVAQSHSGIRLWVDFGDDPPLGYALRLRVTTRNQPYGYRRDDPNGKLSMNERRCAKLAYGEGAGVDVRPHPAGARFSLPLELSGLVRDWLDQSRCPSRDAWTAEVWKRLNSVDVLHCRGETPALRSAWDSIENEGEKEALKDKIRQRIDALAQGLGKVLEAEIPLLRVDPEFFSVSEADSIEPPLSRLFKRIGSNATPLSNADYVYSVLKYIFPDVQGMVDRLQEGRNVACLLTETDLVMSALRLAATKWPSETDRDNPSKEDFHRMIWPKAGDGKSRQDDLRQIIDASYEYGMARLLDLVQVNLEYCPNENEHGLPRHMFPYLGRPLVQVLLRMAQLGQFNTSDQQEARADALRLALYWIQWVFDKPKASRIAFKVMQEPAAHDQMGRKIYEAIVNEGAGIRMHAPESIARLGLAATPPEFKFLRGQSRFVTKVHDIEESRLIREFYRQWWRPWDFRHTMLLWLQRDYVNGLPGDPMAGMENDTPFDFDHILPQSHWGLWTGVGKGARLLDINGDKDAYFVIGHGIGNVRVWDASHNRGDGDASPRLKMGEEQSYRDKWATDSAIEPSQITLWQKCSPESEDKKKVWNEERAMAFQKVVEMRTFDLYVQLCRDAGFNSWFGSTASPS